MLRIGLFRTRTRTRTRRSLHTLPTRQPLAACPPMEGRRSRPPTERFECTSMCTSTVKRMLRMCLFRTRTHTRTRRSLPTLPARQPLSRRRSRRPTERFECTSMCTSTVALAKPFPTPLVIVILIPIVVRSSFHPVDDYGRRLRSTISFGLAVIFKQRLGTAARLSSPKSSPAR